MISGTLSYASAGTHPVTVTATDGAATAAQSFTWTVTNVNRAPVLTPIADQTSAENAAITLAVTASDPDGDRADLQRDGPAAGLDDQRHDGRHRRDAELRERRHLPGDGDGDRHRRSTGSTTFTWTVTNVNRAPVVTAIADQTSAENAAISLAVAASDPDSDTLTYSATGLPPALTINATTGVISGTLSYTSAGTHAVTVTATDGTLAASESFTWTVTNVNRAPVVTARSPIRRAPRTRRSRWRSWPAIPTATR